MLTNITTINYRNIKKLEIELSKFNLIIEQNGSGKTNFLESIYYSVFRSSFRPMSSYKEIIGPESQYSKVNCNWNSNLLELVISNDTKLQKQVKLNDKRPKLSNAIKKFPIILFAPHSVDLASGAPEIRRKDLDDFLSLVDVQYLNNIKRYFAVLKNRNTLIKMVRENKSDPKELEYWTAEISKLGAFIFEKRREFFQNIIEHINSTSNEVYHDLEDFSVNYLPNIEIAPTVNVYETILNKYLANQQKEIVVGKTLYGIHKDNYEFSFNTLSQIPQTLKYHGSRGQQRIGSFIFKIAQFKLLQGKNDEDVLFLIADIMSELNIAHRDNIANYLLGMDAQFIITGADINEIPKNLVKESKLLEIN